AQIGTDGQVNALVLDLGNGPGGPNLPLPACDFPVPLPLPKVGPVSIGGAGCDALIHDIHTSHALVTDDGLFPIGWTISVNVYPWAEYDACVPPVPPRYDEKKLTNKPFLDKPENDNLGCTCIPSPPGIFDPTLTTQAMSGAATGTGNHSL